MRPTPHQLALWATGGTVALSLLAAEQRVVVALSALAVYAVLAALGVSCMRLAFFGPTYCAPPQSRRDAIALTFDDGPDPSLTPQVLDILGRYRIRATFFLIGRKVVEYPDLVRRIHARGHTIACHDLRHGALSNFRLKRHFVADIGASLTAIERIIGRRPTLYRPPIGLTNPQLLAALDDLGLYCIGWNRSMRDAGNRLPHRIIRLPDLAAGGTVAMLHDVLPRAELRVLYLERLEMLCRRIRDQRLRACTVDEIFALPAYRRAGDAARRQQPARFAAGGEMGGHQGRSLPVPAGGASGRAVNAHSLPTPSHRSPPPR